MVIEKESNRVFLVISAWIVTLLVSILPDILFQELTGDLPAWLYWAKVVVVCSLLLTSLIWKSLRSLQLFFGVLLAVYLLQWGVGWFYQTVDYQAWFAGQIPFYREMLSVQIPRATTGMLMVLIMLMLVRSFDRFFFVKGRLDAPAEPIPLVLTRPPSWRILGPAITVAMCIGLIVFVFLLGSTPSTGALRNVLPLLPFVFLFAASNAFGEEMIYRSPWLAALEGPAGPVHALLMTAAYFGIYHFYGVPYGLLGVVMAFIPGWLMGKAMLETRGFFWAWFIHLWMDVVIFFFIALGSVTPGG